MVGLDAESATATSGGGVREKKMPAPILRYGVSILTVAAAFLVTGLFRAVLEPTVFLLFLAAVMVTA